MACGAWELLKMEERAVRWRDHSYSLFPGNSVEQRVQAAAILAGIAEWETGILIQIRSRSNSPWLLRGPFKGMECPPPYRPPAILDNYTTPGDVAQGLINPAILSTSVADYAKEVGLVKPKGKGWTRGEGAVTGLSNLVLEQAMLNDDEKAVKQFSVSAWSHFLGAGFRMMNTTHIRKPGLPPEYDTMEDLEKWYEEASYSEHAAAGPVMDAEGACFGHAHPGLIFDDEQMGSSMGTCHCGGSMAGATYWAKIKGGCIKRYTAWLAIEKQK